MYREFVYVGDPVPELNEQEHAVLVDTPFFGEKKAADTFSAGTLFGRA